MSADWHYLELEVESELVPTPVPYSVLLPPQEVHGADPLPLCLMLHGGGGNRDFLSTLRPAIESASRDGKASPMIYATVSAGRSFYVDYRDGSQSWETFLTGPFLAHLRATLPVRADAAGTFLCGISMGGLGALRMAFRNPEAFHAVAALEPGVDPALAFRDVPATARFYRPDSLFEELFGNPVDEAHWASNNPANIAIENAARVRQSGIAVLIEAGDQDFFNLHIATEFLHRVLWDNGIPHEYHLVRWADHVGKTVAPRFEAALAFLRRSMSPPEPDEAVIALRRAFGREKAAAEAAVAAARPVSPPS